MASEKKIKVEEKKTKRYTLPNGIEFYVIDDLIEAETGGNLTLSGGAGASRSTKRVTHALIVHDPSYGTMPYDVWQDKTRELVMGTMGAYGDPSDVPHADSIMVTTSGSVIDGVSCSECGFLIPFKESRCPKCGALSPNAG